MMNQMYIQMYLVILFSAMRGVKMDRVRVHPTLVVQAEGMMSQFTCELHNINAISIKWSIGGTYLSQYHPHGVSTSSRGPTSVLNIPARREFNGTAIKCTAVDINFVFEASNAVRLLVQGPLSAVRNLDITSYRHNGIMIISWLPPFSLNLTDVEPDVIYCVNVSKVFYDSMTHVVTNCTVLGTEFIFTTNEDAPNGYYVVNMFARSNTRGAQNGSATTVIGPLPSDTKCINAIEAGLQHLNTSFSGHIPLNDGSSCYANISTVDNPLQTVGTSSICSFSLSPQCTLYNGSCLPTLLHNRKYIGYGHCYGLKTIVFSLSLNTHAIQGVTIQRTEDLINIFYHYAVGSTDIGCFMIAMYLNTDRPPLYRAVYRRPGLNRLTLNANITGIKLLSFYDIKVGNLLSQFPAYTETLIQNGSSIQDTSAIKQSTMITKMKLCHKARHSSYLAVYHSCFIRNNYAKPLFSFLYNIRNNSGQANTSMCVEVSPSCYWVAVFSLNAHGNLNDTPLTIEIKDIESQQDVMIVNMREVVTNEEKKERIIAHNNYKYKIALGVSVFIITVLVCTVSILIAVYWCKSKRKQVDRKSNFEMNACEAYEAVKLQRSPEYQMHHDVHYETVFF